MKITAQVTHLPTMFPHLFVVGVEPWQEDVTRSIPDREHLNASAAPMGSSHFDQFRCALN